MGGEGARRAAAGGLASSKWQVVSSKWEEGGEGLRLGWDTLLHRLGMNRVETDQCLLLLACTYIPKDRLSEGW